MLKSDYDGKDAVESVRSIASTIHPLITQRTRRVRAALRARSFSEVAPSPTLVTLELDGDNGAAPSHDSDHAATALQRFFRGVGHPSRSEWLRVIDEVPESAAVRFSGGEPLRSPHLEALLFEADSRGLETEIVTDGRALEEHAPVVYGLGVARVRLVFYGLEDAHNRTICDPRAFERAVRGALALRGLRYGTSRPLLVIHLVIRPGETGWAASMVECALAIGADQVVVHPPTCVTDHERKACRGVRGELHIEELKEIERRWRKASVRLFPSLAPERLEKFIMGEFGPIAPKRCLVPWTSATVSDSGLVRLCAADAVGDIRSASLGDIYNGQAARSLRRALGSDVPLRCSQCVRRFGDEDFRR